ncbi:ATP-binding cassette domain-containing protein [Acidobacteria bacterium AB60]|nr:ATP-binding cassette domain-containing protein [Acidobacteria bacterium AB60]
MRARCCADAEAPVLEIDCAVRHGAFHLQMKTRFIQPWTVIFGPSGSGKSTLLRLLAGLDPSAPALPGHARILFDGVPLTDTAARVWIRPGQRSTALVTQRTALFPHLSVAENVAYGLVQLSRTQRDERVREMLDLVDARDFLDRRPHGLSGGEAQRIALARALAPGPKLLLLDEPFSALDGATSDVLLDRLRAWVKAHEVQTILATHDAADAFVTAADVALLREGRLVALGPATTVLAEERNRLIGRLS